jgi:hypothetical protein
MKAEKLGILFHSQTGDHPQEDLAKFGYRLGLDMKAKFF